MTPTPPKPTFLTLPAEIRNIIYHFVVDSSNPITPYLPQLTPHDRQTPPATKIALTRTCKKLNEEFAAIFYPLTTFKFFNVWYMGDFLQSIGESKRRLLRNIEFRDHGTGRVKCFALLAECVGLERLTMGITRKAIISILEEPSEEDLLAMEQLMKVRCQELIFRRAHKNMVVPTGTMKKIKAWEDELKSAMCKDREEALVEAEL